jgi:hypothetical protein
MLNTDQLSHVSLVHHCFVDPVKVGLENIKKNNASSLSLLYNRSKKCSFLDCSILIIKKAELGHFVSFLFRQLEKA